MAPQADFLKVAIAQMAPVWLNREQTLAKVCAYVERAGEQGCQLVAFGEALVPGYPFWLELTDGARFNSPVQKTLHAHYLDQAVRIEAGHLGEVCALAKRYQMVVVVGVIERPLERGGHSLYCALVYITPAGEIGHVHRKLMPTYEERLTWSPGDGHGLQVHPLGKFTVGGLLCWENWMPLPRAALYALGEDLHVALWPGNLRNTQDITRFMAVEGRSYVLSAPGLMRKTDFPADTPHLDAILANADDLLANGGACLAAPDGTWVIEPMVGEEGVYTAEINHARVRGERQNFDPSGHYSRPDVTQLTVNRERQSILKINP
ncbi:MAG: carbon-nitrogen hydrolase family protein [Chloroflexi bacterium]|nr:carbon-nitrogen hydrolase family protein [Chloroflexota bacterium]